MMKKFLFSFLLLCFSFFFFANIWLELVEAVCEVRDYANVAEYNQAIAECQEEINARMGAHNQNKEQLTVLETQVNQLQQLIASAENQIEQTEAEIFEQEVDLGYQKEGLISILIQEKEEETAQRLVNLFQNKVKFNPNIKGVTASVSRFGLSSGPNVGRDEKSCHYNRVDPNFLNVLELELVEGRNFSQDRSTDKNSAIVNQKFLQTFEVESSIGKTIREPFF